MGKINKKLLPLKLLLFFLYAAIGCLPAFLTIHMYHIGLTHEEVIWINTVLPLTALIGPPFVGYLADRFGHYRLITITSMFLAGVFHTALLFVPERTPITQPNMQMICGSEGASLVLQSCTGECPQIRSDLMASFRISNCRQECNIYNEHCGSFAFALEAIRNSTESLAESTISSKVPPEICLHNNNDIRCVPFGFTSYIEISKMLNSSSQQVSYFENHKDCCEYPIKDFETTDHFSNMTCNPLPNCHVVCSVTEIVNKSSFVLQTPSCETEGSNNRVTFWLYFCLRAIADMFPAILISLFDAVVLTMVALHGGDYGRQKMFGLFAIGTSAPLVGYLMDGRIGVYGKYIYSPVFYVFDALLILTSIITVLLPIKVEVQRTSMLKNLTKLIRTVELNFLFLIVILLGALNGYLETFLYIHLITALGASKLLLGFTITVGILPSVPFLYKSDLIVNYCGHHYLLILAFVGYCVRFAGLSYLTNPYWVLPLEALELFTINLMQVTAATLAYKLAPKSLVATAQGLVWMSHFDIGRAIGTVVGGYLIKEYGMIPVFQMASVFSAVCAAIYLASYQLLKYIKSSRSKAPLPEQAKEKEKEKENCAVSNGNYMLLPVADQKS